MGVQESTITDISTTRSGWHVEAPATDRANPFAMSSQPQPVAMPLPVHAIHLERDGGALVTLRAPVTNTKHFFFTVPKTQMQLVVDSLEVSDTRGGMPRVTFPAPIVTTVKPLVIKKDSAWHDLVTSHQGAHVALQTHTGPVQGYLLGFQQLSTRDEPAVVLLSDGNVCVHEVDSIAALSFKGVQVVEKLERYTSTLCRMHEEDNVYRIDVTASGEGAGELCVSYATEGPHSAMYDVSYTMHADDNGDCKTMGEARTGYPKMRVTCYAIIRNPLHYDLRDVRFTLNSGKLRSDLPQTTYTTASEDWRYRPQSKSRSRSPSPSRSSRSPPSRSAVSKARSRSGSSYSPSDSDSDSDVDTDTGSIRAMSATSWNARICPPLRKWDVPDKLCIEEGGSVKVMLSETRIEGGIVYYHGAEEGMKRSLLLRNTSETVLEPGHAMLFEKYRHKGINFTLSCFNPGEVMHLDVSAMSACAVRTEKSSRRGAVVCSRMVGETLVADVVWNYKKKYYLHNKEDEEVEALIEYNGVSNSRQEGTVKAKFYTETPRPGDEEEDEGGESMDPYAHWGLRLWSYRIRVTPKQQCALVVSETVTQEEVYTILEDCSRRSVARLEEKGVVGSDVAGKLRQLAEMKKEMEELKRRGRLYRRRIEGVKAYERGLVKRKKSDKKPEEEKDGADGNEKFFAAVSRAEGLIRELGTELDANECSMVMLKSKVKKAKEEICDMKRVELHEEIKQEN